MKWSNNASAMAATTLAITLLTGFATHALAETWLEIETVYNDRLAVEFYESDLDSVNAHFEQAHYYDHDDYWFDYWYYDSDFTPVYFADTGTQLYGDQDVDGYFNSFSLSMDIDSSHGMAEVQVAIHLLNDDHVHSNFHVTDIFYVYGYSIMDRYHVELQLLSDFPAGQYDVVLELIDATNGTVLDRLDHQSHSHLYHLPLEARDLDNPLFHTGNTEWDDNTIDDWNDEGWDDDDDDWADDVHPDVVVTEFGGSMGIVGLGLLLLLVVRRHLKAVTLGND